MTSEEVEKLEAILSGGSVQVTPVMQRTHLVVSGDTLWSLSFKYLGTGFRYRDIYNANKQMIKDPALIYVGQKLTIPEK